MPSKWYILPILVWLTFISLDLVSAQNINTLENFPDPIFRTSVELFMETSPGGAFSAQEAAVQTGMLDCSLMDIQNLKGIEFFTGITRLSCSFNSLTSLDLSKNVSLERLDCYLNSLDILILPPQSSLRTLDCSFNQLTDIVNLKTQPFLGLNGYVDVRYNNLTCDDWETISFLRDTIGEAVYEHDPDFDFDYLSSGFAFSPQNDSDLSECENIQPTQPPAATPTPTRTPTPVAAATPTPISCLREPIQFEFNQSGLAANGWAEIPGGFIPNTSSGSFLFRNFSSQEFPESQDGKGLAVTVRPGQVTFLYAVEAIRTGDSPVLLRLHARTSSPAAQVGLVALKGYPGRWNGSLGVALPNNMKQALNQEFREVLLYQPDDEGVITPAIQVVGLPGEGDTTVLLDRLEILPVSDPVFSSTGFPCDSPFIQIPDPKMLYRNDFSAASLQQNGWGEIPGGFTGMNAGMSGCGAFPDGSFVSSQDRKGIAITVQSGQVELLYASQAIDAQGYPLLLKMNVRANSPDVAIALGALKGDLATNQNVDGSIAYQIPANANSFIQQERQIVIVYEPDEGTLVTPIIQAAAGANAEDVQVFIDSFEVYILDKETFAYHPAGAAEPTYTPTPTYKLASTNTPTSTYKTISTYTPTPTYTPTYKPTTIFTPTPTNLPEVSPTPMIPVVVDGAAGGTITLSDQASVVIPAGFTSSEVNIAFNRVAAPSNQRTDEYAVMSGEYELSINTKSNLNADLVLVLPVVSNEWRNSVDFALAGVQYFDETEGVWKSLGALAEFDPSTNLLTFRLPLPQFDGSAASAKTMNRSATTIYAASDTVFLGGVYKRKFRVYIPFFGSMFITSLESSNFKIHYYPQTVKKNAAWSAVGSGVYEDTLVPDYIEDLDKAMNEALKGLLALKRNDGSAVFTDPTAGLIGKNTLDVYVRDLGTADGNTAPRGWFSGRIQIHETKLANWQDMRGVAAHELCHYLQGDYYSLGGKPAAWFFGNLWFFEATANYYSALAMKMDSAQKKAYWSETMAKYLSVPITASEEASYYTLAHFLDWLENERFPGKAVVAEALNQRFYDTNDRINLNTAIQNHSSSTNSLAAVFQEYCEFIVTHPIHPVSDGLTGLIKDSLSADILAYLTPKEAVSRTWVELSTKTGKPSLYFEIKRQLDSLSAAYLRLQTKTTEEGLMVARYDQCQGEGLAVTSTLTYAPAGSDDAWYETNERLDKLWVFTNPLSVKNFGGTSGVASFEQTFINRGLASGSQMVANLHCQYYLLLPPEIIEIQDGSVLWSTNQIGNIPLELIAGYDVYLLDNPQATHGVKLNPTPIPYTALQQSYTNAVIKKTDAIVVSVRDTLGFCWPEIIPSTVLIEDITCDSAPVGAQVVVTGKGFGASQGASRILFCGKEVTKIISWSDARIALQVPAGAKTGTVIVTVNGEKSNAYSYIIDEFFSDKLDRWKENASVWVSFYPIVDYSVVISSELIQSKSDGKIAWMNSEPGTITGQAEMDYYSRNSQGENFKYKTVKITFEDIPLILWCHCVTYDAFLDFETITECDNPVFLRFGRSGRNPNGVGLEIKTYNDKGALTGTYDTAQTNDYIELYIMFTQN